MSPPLTLFQLRYIFDCHGCSECRSLRELKGQLLWMILNFIKTHHKDGIKHTDCVEYQMHIKFLGILSQISFFRTQNIIPFFPQFEQALAGNSKLMLSKKTYQTVPTTTTNKKEKSPKADTTLIRRIHFLRGAL